jgi:hypothetical protein
MPTLSELRAAYEKRKRDAEEARKEQEEEIAQQNAIEKEEAAALAKAKRNPSLRSSKKILDKAEKEEKALKEFRAKQRAALAEEYTPSPSALAFQLKRQARLQALREKGDIRGIFANS